MKSNVDKMVCLLLIYLVVILADAKRYHQSDYTVKMVRAEIQKYNPDFLENPTVALVYYNRTFRGINATFNLRKSISNMKVTFQAYILLSNEYRFFPITMEINGCKTLAMDEFGVRSSLAKASNVPFRCPLPKGLLKLSYATIDFSNFPPFIPQGQYKASLGVYQNLDFVGNIDVYTEVNPIMKNWEN